MTNANRFCCYGRGVTSVCATSVETIGLARFNALQRLTSFHMDCERSVEKNRIKLDQLQWEERQCVPT